MSRFGVDDASSVACECGPCLGCWGLSTAQPHSPFIQPEQMLHLVPFHTDCSKVNLGATLQLPIPGFILGVLSRPRSPMLQTPPSVPALSRRLPLHSLHHSTSITPKGGFIIPTTAEETGPPAITIPGSSQIDQSLLLELKIFFITCNNGIQVSVKWWSLR